MVDKTVKIRRVGQLLAECGNTLDTHRAITLAHHAIQALNLPGEFLEFGCYRGESAAFLSCVTERCFYLYDSFEGLPQPAAVDAVLIADWLRSTEETCIAKFSRVGVPKPVIRKAWFKDLRPDDLPTQVAFAHVDCDLYASITDALNLVWPRLVKGGVVIVDDYDDPMWRGVKPACDQFFVNREHRFVHPTAHQAAFLK